MTKTSFVPKMEIGVRELFAQRASRLGYRIIESRARFPDYVLEQDGQRLFAEAELRTSDFLRHRHEMARCDLIVVWEHDLPFIPIPVLELKSERLHLTSRRRSGYGSTPSGRQGSPRGPGRPKTARRSWFK